MNRQNRDERLRHILREGDPAAGDPGLTLEEAREMRRAVLNAVPERRRRLLPVFAWAGAALVAVAVLVAALLLQRPEAAPAPRVAEVVKETAGTAATAETPVAETEKTETVEVTAKKRPHRRRTPAPATSATSNSPDRIASAAPAVEPEEPRQIQFSTPGGTRIIWVISPGEASHTK
ncbi:MAG: hypothetical protein ACJ75H_14290 [Thermoanaerobaculia bacterium]